MLHTSDVVTTHALKSRRFERLSRTSHQGEHKWYKHRTCRPVGNNMADKSRWTKDDMDKSRSHRTMTTLMTFYPTIMRPRNGNTTSP